MWWDSWGLSGSVKKCLHWNLVARDERWLLPFPLKQRVNLRPAAGATVGTAMFKQYMVITHLSFKYISQNISTEPHADFNPNHICDWTFWIQTFCPQSSGHEGTYWLSLDLVLLLLTNVFFAVWTKTSIDVATYDEAQICSSLQRIMLYVIAQFYLGQRKRIGSHLCSVLLTDSSEAKTRLWNGNLLYWCELNKELEL